MKSGEILQEKPEYFEESNNNYNKVKFIFSGRIA